MVKVSPSFVLETTARTGTLGEEHPLLSATSAKYMVVADIEGV